MLTRGRIVVSLALLALTAGVLGVASAAAVAQPETEAPAEDLPPAEELFERYIEVIGGREAIEAQFNRRIEGTFRGQPFNGAARLTIWADAPNKLHVKINEPLGFKFEMCYDGERVWERANDNPPREVVGARAIEMIESADFIGEANYKDRYKVLETSATGELQGRKVYAVKAVSHNDRERRLYFDAESGLFVAEQNQVARLGESNKFELRLIEIFLSGYEEFGGVLYPTFQSQKVFGDPNETKFEYTRVRVNVENDEHDYSAPEGLILADPETMQPGDG